MEVTPERRSEIARTWLTCGVFPDKFVEIPFVSFPVPRAPMAVVNLPPSSLSPARSTATCTFCYHEGHGEYGGIPGYRRWVECEGVIVEEEIRLISGEVVRGGIGGA